MPQANSENTEPTPFEAMDVASFNIEQANSLVMLMIEGFVLPNGHLVPEVPYSPTRLMDTLYIVKGFLETSGANVQALYSGSRKSLQ